jgi:hypothetical protein
MTILDHLIGVSDHHVHSDDTSSAIKSTNEQVSEVWRDFHEMDALVTVAETNLRARGALPPDRDEPDEGYQG